MKNNLMVAVTYVMATFFYYLEEFFNIHRILNIIVFYKAKY